MSTVLASAPCTASDFPLFMLVVVLGFFADFSSKKVNLTQYFVIKTDPYAVGKRPMCRLRLIYAMLTAWHNESLHRKRSPVSPRFGHGLALTVHRTAIHFQTGRFATL